jgi:acyl carrier protein
MRPINQELHQFIRDNFLFGQEDVVLHDQDSFLERGIIDSTGVLELVMFLEKTYHIHVDDEDLIPANLDTIDNLVRYVTRKRQADPVISEATHAHP